jgi:predicted metal-dependent hydrolase
MPELTFGQEQVMYEVVRSGRTTIGIEVQPDRRVVVRAPASVDEERLNVLIKQKAPWILRQFARVQSTNGHKAKKEFISGESFPYLGKNYRLKVLTEGLDGLTSVELRAGRLWVVPNSSLDAEDRRRHIRDSIVNWYQERALDVLTRRVESLSKKTGIKPTRVNVKSQLRRWGSCTKNGVLNLNWRIVMAPSSIIDYVVAHELCHLKIHNHSQDFWQFLGAILPDYQRHREWLRNNGQHLDF